MLLQLERVPSLRTIEPIFNSPKRKTTKRVKKKITGKY